MAARDAAVTNFLWALLTSPNACDDQAMNAEPMVAIFRRSLQGLLTHVRLSDADRVAVTEIDAKAAQLVPRYRDAVGPHGLTALAREMEGLHREVAAITTRSHRS